MPTYVYECQFCGTFEVQQSIKDDALTHCPGGHPVKRNVTYCNLNMAETQRASYFAGREGDARMARHMAHNAHIAKGVKDGTIYDPKPGEGQPREIFTDLERRLKA